MGHTPEESLVPILAETTSGSGSEFVALLMTAEPTTCEPSGGGPADALEPMNLMTFCWREILRRLLNFT